MGKWAVDASSNCTPCAKPDSQPIGIVMYLSFYLVCGHTHLLSLHSKGIGGGHGAELELDAVVGIQPAAR